MAPSPGCIMQRSVFILQEIREEKRCSSKIMDHFCHDARSFWLFAEVGIYGKTYEQHTDNTAHTLHIYMGLTPAFTIFVKHTLQ